MKNMKEELLKDGMTLEELEEILYGHVDDDQVLEVELDRVGDAIQPTMVAIMGMGDE